MQQMRLSDRLRPSWLMRRFLPGSSISVDEARRGPLPATLGRVGSLEVRLARSAREVRLCQALRYHVFYREMSAQSGSFLRRRDVDGFDAICDHLLVLDHDPPPGRFRGSRRGKPSVVGTYRLLRQEVAEQFGGFYTSSEFDIEALATRKQPMRFLELGRSCVLKPYRTKRTVELLWAGIWAYVRYHRIDVMIGCASLEGVRPDDLAVPLSFLHHNALAPAEWRVSALPGRYVSMNRLPPEAVDTRTALHSLPPLLKGYLRLGAWFGDGAVVDQQFGTTDVCVILPVSSINPRYIEHFSGPRDALS